MPRKKKKAFIKNHGRDLYKIRVGLWRAVAISSKAHQAMKISSKAHQAMKITAQSFVSTKLAFHNFGNALARTLERNCPNFEAEVIEGSDS